MDYKKKYNEAQKWIESIYSELSHEQQMEAEAFFPELKESEDEKMMHQLHSWMKEFGGAEEYTEKVYTWLKSLLEKQGEQKPTDEVEPKFQNGQWIVWQNKCYKVNYNGCGYELIDQNGLSTSLEYGTVDKSASAFTIQDAKDGDVLACPLPKGCESGEQIFIFKGINSRDYVDNCIEYYCRICDGVFYVNKTGYMGTTSSPLYPATKEQRDALFAKMKEAGYEWDTEKKELKKISQKMVSAEAKEALYDKPAWSEEDDNCLSTIIAVFSICSRKSVSKDEWMRCNDFLNSLKGRVQPRKQWKPSAGQMKALHDLNLTGNISYAGQGQVLIELYNDLKKLTE